MPNDKNHLTYCTNIHAGESWPDHFLALQKCFPDIKAQVSPDEDMGIGLRLSHVASLDLIKKSNLDDFKKWLKEENAYVFTMNGFPYGGFHNTVVKADVHTPDWTTDERRDYSIRLFDILKNLLPDGMDGGVSTSPMSYRYWFETPDALEQATVKATENILKVAEHLISIRQETAQIMHLDIEPEPDGILETGEEFIAWFDGCLLPVGKKRIAEKFGISAGEAEALIKDHIRLCYDVCHFAIGYEPHEEVLDKLEQKGIRVGKYQISAALKADLPKDPQARTEIKEAFIRFNEPTYLHQVVARQEDGSVLRYRDLPEALQDIEHTGIKEWRAHFHVPVFAQYPGLVKSTQDDISEVLKIHKKRPFTRHLEVETYTWEVLPESMKLPLKESIIRELLWVKEQL
jgi:hypothetical protein